MLCVMFKESELENYDMYCRNRIHISKKVKNKLMFKILLTTIITNRRKFMKSKLRSLLCAVGRTGLFVLPCSTKRRVDYYQESKVFFNQGVKEIRNYSSDSSDKRLARKFLDESDSEITEFSNESSGWTTILHQKDKVNNTSIGYIIADTYISYYSHGLNKLFRMDQRIEMASGKVASKAEAGYDAHWVGNNAIIKTTIAPHTSNTHYGSFTAPTPNYLYGWPNNAPQYKTITSGFNAGLSWGSTRKSEGYIGSDAFGVKASDSFTSNFNIGFSYSETYQQSYPSLDSAELSKSEGHKIVLTHIRGKNIEEKTITFTTGMLFESKRDSDLDAYSIYTDVTTEIVFNVQAYLNKKAVTYKQTFEPDTTKSL